MAHEAKIISVVDEDKKKKKVENKVEKKEKKKKKKIKFKGKKIVLFIIAFFLVIGAFSGGFVLYQKNALKTLKKNYSTVVVTTKKTRLFDKNKKDIGSIQKNITLNLKKVSNLSLKNKLLNIEGTSYYVSYKDIKKKKEKKEEVKDSYYLPTNIHIKSKKDVQLSLDGKKVITLKNGIDSDVNYIDSNSYYIDFLGQIMSIKKDKSIKETTTDKVIENAATHVSNIYYERIDDGCGDDICLKNASVRVHINKLKNEGFYFITKEDYIAFLKGYRNLKDKAILVSTGVQNEYTEDIFNTTGVKVETFTEEDGIQFQTTNKTSTREDSLESVNRYQAKRYTLIDDYSTMAYGNEVADNGPQTSSNQSIAVVNYHFFYDASKGESCNESICLEISKFREQLQWLQDNGYKTLTIHEFADWMDGVIEVPEKSILLTIDDGAMGTGSHNGNLLIPALEEYKMHATLFLITGWWGLENYQSPYLDVQSHTHNLHYEASCPDGRGLVACSDYATVKADLEESLSILGDNTSFCFPFYSSDQESLQAVSELGFRDAFVGGNVKARRSDNHHLIPRYPILSDISLNGFINKVR